MISYLSLPIIFLKFWYIEAPMGMIGYFASLNKAFLELFALPLFLRTFFKPLKNEYRQGLVGFSRFLGMIIKSFFIIVDTSVLLILLVCELCLLTLFLLFPIVTLFLLHG